MKNTTKEVDIMTILVEPCILTCNILVFAGKKMQ
ncbi:MAG: hypothetical protein SRB2_01640 [Desulfobacteraceae bacterium Eth-SRB2]|nr:MAG: hypothetical protein SRB2_01640 [Desulfobacteraceae bacterium Eth-SRB2]